MKHRPLQLGIAALIALASSSAESPAKESHHKPAFDRDAAIAQLLQLHNKNRADDNAPPLQINPKLAASAQAYADYLARTGQFTHTADGSPGTRAKIHGYKWTLVGENIAKGQPTPESVVKAWMNSPGHRANILNKHYKDIGFGIAQDPKGQILWVTDLAHP